MIHELLAEGATNARTGRELAALLGCTLRDITLAVERERREGQPICANMTGENAGYYLAANAEELQAYCNRLHHRAAELYKTRGELLKVLKQYAATKTETGGLTDGEKTGTTE